MLALARAYYENLGQLMGRMTATDRQGVLMDCCQGVASAAQLVLATGAAGGKLMFIGNGASAAISSHMSTDYWKNGGIRATAFSDPALLTCIGNDHGYDRLFAEPVRMFADAGDILVAISSSGRSPNILNAVDAARECDCTIITLSGFREDNPLRTLGDLNFHVPCERYGPVEILHHSLCHCILDSILDGRSR